MIDADLNPYACRKNRYPDKKAAQSELNRIMRHRRRHRPESLRIYFCPRCHAWHLTHQEPS